MVLEVAMADRDAYWSLWQAPVSESQDRCLGFWIKALPSSPVHNYSPFEKQLLVCLSRDWTLNHAPQHYHVTWAGCCLIQLAIKLSMHSSSPSSNGSDIYKISLKQTLKAQVTMKKWPKSLRSPILLDCLFFLSLHLWLMGSSLWSTDRGRENSGLFSRWFCAVCRHHSPFLEHYLNTLPFCRW